MEPIDFPTFCAELLDEPISKAWQVFYAAVDGLPLDEEGVELFRACTGRDRYEPRAYTEATGICGRRSEKTSSALKFLIWKSLFAGWERQGSWLRRAIRGKPLRIPLIAQDMRVVKDILRTGQALVTESAVVSAEVEDIRVNEIVFRNGISLICLPASKASVRGLTCPAGLLDELAWVSIEGADDRELVWQIKPSMIQFGAARRLLKMSTPWQRSGVIHTEYSERAARQDLLVWQASTQVMTPRIPIADLERERAADASYFAREYLAEFTSDLEQFIPGGDIDAAVGNWRELPPAKGNFYIAALDASGLTGGDRFTFGVAHSDKDGAAVVDALRGWTRETVPQVCDEIAALCKAYGILNVVADQYSFSFLAELLRQRGIGLEQLSFNARSKAEIYFDLKTCLAQGTLRLPQHSEMIRELRALESARLSGGGYRISAPRGQHDNFVTMLALLANKVKRSGARAEPWSWVPDVPVAVRQGFNRWGNADKYASLVLTDPGPERWWHKLN